MFLQASSAHSLSNGQNTSGQNNGSITTEPFPTTPVPASYRPVGQSLEHRKMEACQAVKPKLPSTPDYDATTLGYDENIGEGSAGNPLHNSVYNCPQAGLQWKTFYYLAPQINADFRSILSLAINESVYPAKNSSQRQLNLMLYNQLIPTLITIPEGINHTQWLPYVTIWINWYDHYGFTALKYAAKHGVLPCIRTLITMGASPLKEIITTSLHEALFKEKTYEGITPYRVLKELLEAIKETSPDDLDKVINLKPTQTNLILSEDIDNNSKRILHSGNTVLHEVMCQNEMPSNEMAELIQLLLSYGANPLLKNAYNETAFSLWFHTTLNVNLFIDMINAVDISDLALILQEPCRIQKHCRSKVEELIILRIKNTDQPFREQPFKDPAYLSESETDRSTDFSREASPQSPASVISELSTSSNNSKYSDYRFNDEQNILKAQEGSVNGTLPTSPGSVCVQPATDKRNLETEFIGNAQPVASTPVNFQEMNEGVGEGEGFDSINSLEDEERIAYLLSPTVKEQYKPNTGDSNEAIPANGSRKVSKLNDSYLSNASSSKLSDASSTKPASPETRTEPAAQKAFARSNGVKRKTERQEIIEAKKRSLMDIKKMAKNEPTTKANIGPPYLCLKKINLDATSLTIPEDKIPS